MPESERNSEEVGHLANQVKAFARAYMRAGGFDLGLPFTKAVLDMADEAVWAGTNIGNSSLRTAKIALRAKRRGLDAGPFRKASDLGYDIFAAYQTGISEDLLRKDQAQRATRKATDTANRTFALRQKFSELINPDRFWVVGNVNSDFSKDIVYTNKSTPPNIKDQIRKRSLTEDVYQTHVKRIEQAEAARVHAETYLYLPDRSGRRLDQQAVVAYAESLLNSPPANISDENYWQAYRSAIIALLNGESLLKSELRNQGLDITDLMLKVHRMRVGFIWDHVKSVTDLRRQARLQHLRDTGTF